MIKSNNPHLVWQVGKKGAPPVLLKSPFLFCGTYPSCRHDPWLSSIPDPKWLKLATILGISAAEVSSISGSVGLLMFLGIP